MTRADRPRVSLHFAQSLDGRIALTGTRTPLSSRAGFELAHRARTEHDAVLVGRATVWVDDPRLAVHCAVNSTSAHQPRRIVLASTLDIPPGARLLRGGPGTLVIGVAGRAPVEARERLEAAGAEVRLVPAGDDGLVSLPDALAAIRVWGVERLLVEGGACVLSALLRQRLADEATIEIVPRLLGSGGVAAIGEIGVTSIEQAVVLQDARVERAEDSIVVRGRLAY
ncbi:MAG TPA: dihydrofolate reductase family protein [Polyangiaceae bacterium]|jgi:5-amino-6-(5-phosphoribosylamino)uracil reductase/diaminohydroxyphosphoribosylaminopyrimidine deaminase/5-amino-6-(5-phosphoribosylamino)uracil reductase|nr:dihydrofolate reductase family protein [Polyangiaceae bacterium]